MLRTTFQKVGEDVTGHFIGNNENHLILTHKCPIIVLVG